MVYRRSSRGGLQALIKGRYTGADQGAASEDLCGAAGIFVSRENTYIFSSSRKLYDTL